MFNGKHVLITGGTGSFGQEMVRYLLSEYKPERLIVFSRDELKQHEMQQKFQSESLRFFLGDVRDSERLAMAFRGVDYVIHAAALKHVPAAEYNPMECIKTNVLGAGNVISAALACGVQKVVALSTDKAANPVNLYGASKLASDKLFVAANNVAGKLSTRFSIVRYGNVMNSRGSVVPLFRSLIERGAAELPITDPRMTRFWISIRQGVEFVARCFGRMSGGEIFVPKMPSSRVTDLAEAVAPGIPTRIIGIRPGEKLHEVLCPRDSYQQTIEFQDFFVIAPTIVMQDGSCYSVTGLKEAGVPVQDGFQYSSDTNSWVMSVKELRALLEHSV